jgi:hypothetical protein
VTIDIALGNCHGDSNPDAWFPEVPQGNFSNTKKEKIGSEMRRALALCNSCNQKETCLEEGMKEQNLSYGIWGGMLAGERVMLTGYNFPKMTDQGKALISYRVLKPLIGDTAND